MANGHNMPDFDASRIPDLGNIGAATVKGILRQAAAEIPEGSKEVIIIWTVPVANGHGAIGYKSNVDLERGLALTDVVHGIFLRKYLGG